MIALHHHCPCAISQKNYYDADPEVYHPVEQRTPSAKIKIPHAGVVNRTSVSIAHLPDAQPPCSYTIDNASINVIPLPDAAGNCSKDRPL